MPIGSIYDGLPVIAFEDDASRTILAICQTNSHMRPQADNAISSLQGAEAAVEAIVVV